MRYIVSVDIEVEDTRQGRATNSVEAILKTTPYFKSFDILDVQEKEDEDEE